MILKDSFLKERKKSFGLIFQILLFIYFFSLHADQLSCCFLGVSIRFNNLIAFVLGSCIFYELRNFFIFPKRMFFALNALVLSVALSCFINPISFRSVFFYFGLFFL